MDKRFSPPTADVKDSSAETLTVFLRCVWVYGVGELFFIGVILFAMRLIATVFEWRLLLFCVLAAVAFSIVPVRIILAGRTVSPPWWGDILIYAMGALMLYALMIEAWGVVFVCYAILGGLNLAILAALLVAEKRYPVRVYLKGRRWIFVNRETGEIV